MMREKLPCIRNIDKKKIMIEVKKINEVITYLPVDNITELDDTCYGCAATVTKKLVKNLIEREPPWKRRLRKKVQETQQDLSRVKETRNRRYNDRLRRKMEMRFDVSNKGYNQVIEELKQRLITLAAKTKDMTDQNSTSKTDCLRTTRRNFMRTYIRSIWEIVKSQMMRKPGTSGWGYRDKRLNMTREHHR